MPEHTPVEARNDGRFLTFRVSRRRYALSAMEVSEIIRIPPIARLPQSPKALLGVANLRGSVLPIASLRALLGRTETSEDPMARAIVLAGNTPVAITVDAVDALVTLDENAIESHEAALTAESGELLLGAFRAAPDQEVTRILDIHGLLKAAVVQRQAPKQTAGHATRQAETVRMDNEGPAEQMLVTFDVAGQEYAMDIDAVWEIIATPDTIAPVPHAETLVLGVTTIRDRLLPLLSLRGLLGFPLGLEAGGSGKVIVTAVQGVPVGLVVDRMREILRARPDQIDPTPAVLAARTGGETRIKAIYRGDGGKRLVSVLAPEQIFGAEVMQRLGNQTSSEPTRDTDTTATNGHYAPFLVFRLGDEEFALPIGAIDEVAQLPDQITRIPKTPKFLEGVVNLRGEVLPVVDQRRRFDMPKFKGERQRLVVVRAGRHRAGLIVDSVVEVLRVASESIDLAPDLSNESVKLVQGVINLEAASRMVLLLDPEELLTRAEHGLLDAFASASNVVAS